MSDIPTSSSHATKAMEAAREIYWGSDWKEPYPLESQMSPEQILALNDMAAIISKYMPPSVPVIGVKEGESLWLIEQTDEEGTRRFWAGYYWSTSALDAVRFTEYSAAWGLVCFPWWPEVGNPPRRYEKVDVCEHLFQCGIAPEQSVPMADLDTLAQQWLSDAALARDDRAIGYRRCASDLFTLIQRAAPELKP